MKPEEITAVLNGIAPVLRDYVDTADKAMGARVDGLAERLDAIPAQVDAEEILSKGLTDFVAAFVAGLAIEQGTKPTEPQAV